MNGPPYSKPIPVLYIEDDKGEARLLQRHLGRAGFEVILAHSAATGLALHRERQTPLVLLDHGLPDMSGLEVLKALRSNNALSPSVIYVTGLGDETIAVEAMKLGARDYLVKDPDGRYLELLVPVLEKALQDLEVERQNRRGQFELQESEARFRTLFQHAPEALVILDVDTGRFIDANDNAVQLYGLGIERLLEVGPAELSPLVQPDGEPSDQAARGHVARALAGEVQSLFRFWFL